MAGPLAALGRGSGGRGHADVRPGSLQHRRDRGLLRDHATVVHPAQRDPQQGAATRVKYKLSQSVSQQHLHFIIPLYGNTYLQVMVVEADSVVRGKCQGSSPI